MKKYVLVDKDDIVIGMSTRINFDKNVEAACWHYIPDDLEPEIGSVFINNPN